MQYINIAAIQAVEQYTGKLDQVNVYFGTKVLKTKDAKGWRRTNESLLSHCADPKQGAPNGWSKRLCREHIGDEGRLRDGAVPLWASRHPECLVMERSFLGSYSTCCSINTSVIKARYQTKEKGIHNDY